MSVRSLSEIHECGGTAAEFVQHFAAKWHDGDWETAEDHWQLIVNRLLRGREMEGLKRRDALRTAEQAAQNFGLPLLLSASDTRCPMCAIVPPPRSSLSPPPSPPAPRRPGTEPS
ncbi:DUF6313 family protein [Streptomyces lanatus]|uniref:DUF6313 family protein n=1 Tax=Streptomyces lanatus TaxID=66900 RepID=A0ABV1XXZ7_9ACTN|nr:DUF6313 family protein [Streptomyces lanatus]